jgi:hypothetical protein
VDNVVKRLALLASTVAALTLTGCGNDTDTGKKAPELPKSSTSASAAADTAPAEQTANERGSIVEQLGEMACFGWPGKDCDGGVSFAIDQVEGDPQCTSMGSHPENGHTLLLHLRIATGSDSRIADQATGVINPSNFVEVGADGVTREAQFGACADTTMSLPTTFGPNQRFEGVMDLEVTEASGIIALQMMGGEEDGQRGWEWTYPVG